MYKMSVVPTSMVDFMWPVVVARLSEVAELSDGEVTTESTLMRLREGGLNLIVATNGPQVTMAITAEVLTFESGKRSLAMQLMAGSNLEDLKDIFMPFMENLAIENGCVDIKGEAHRKGWARKLKDYGWKPVREVITYKLGDNHA